VLVEGVFDAIVAGNAVPILGSTLRADSKLIKKIVYHDTPVYLAFDEDAQKKENQVIRMLIKYDIELYKIDTTGYEDVGSMSREDNPRKTGTPTKSKGEKINNKAGIPNHSLADTL